MVSADLDAGWRKDGAPPPAIKTFDLLIDVLHRRGRTNILWKTPGSFHQIFESCFVKPVSASDGFGDGMQFVLDDDVNSSDSTDIKRPLAFSLVRLAFSNESAVTAIARG